MKEACIGKKLMPFEEQFYTVFRVLVGLLFFMHGAGKILGWFTAKATMTTGSLMWFVGLAETLVGLLILLGFLTRLGAIIGIVIMITAWFKAHIATTWNPLANGGELALLFLVAFIFILAHGSGKYGLEQLIKKKECL